MDDLVTFIDRLDARLDQPAQRGGRGRIDAGDLEARLICAGLHVRPAPLSDNLSMTETREDRLNRRFAGPMIVLASMLSVCGGAFHPRVTAYKVARGGAASLEKFPIQIAQPCSCDRLRSLILARPLLWLIAA